MPAPNKSSATHPCSCQQCLRRSAFRNVSQSPARCCLATGLPLLTQVMMAEMTKKSPVVLPTRRGGAATTFQCLLCEATFTRKSNLKRHHLVHTGAKRYACHVCAQPFSLRYNLRRHLVKQHGLTLNTAPRPNDSGSSQSP